MTIKKRFFSFLQKQQLDGFAVKQYLRIRQLRRTLRFADKKLLSNYIKESKTLKLHIGCGKNILEGWVNADM